jgi:ParB family chromosome partitioning protein
VAVEVDYSMELEVTGFCVDSVAHGHHTIVAVNTAAAEAQLRDQGVPVADPDAEGVAALDALFADEQAEQTLTAEEHAGCPGHAAYIEPHPYALTVNVVYACTDPTAHGHVRRASLTTPPEHDAAFKAAEIKRAGANNKLWATAKAERRAWLAEYFTGWRKRKTADLPTGVHRWLGLAPVLAPDVLADAAQAHHYACTLLKLPEPKGHRREANPLAVHLRKKTTSETQAVLIRLAQVIGACEEHWDRPHTGTANGSWRGPSDDSRYYFELLDALGYPLSHVEQLINNPDLDNERWPHLATATDTDSGEAEVAADGDRADDTDSQGDAATA